MNRKFNNNRLRITIKGCFFNAMLIIAMFGISYLTGAKLMGDELSWMEVVEIPLLAVLVFLFIPPFWALIGFVAFSYELIIRFAPESGRFKAFKSELSVRSYFSDRSMK